MAISWVDTPLCESSVATMVRAVNSVELNQWMMDSCAAQFSYFGNNLGMTPMLKPPSSKSPVDWQSSLWEDSKVKRYTSQPFGSADAFHLTAPPPDSA
jgi:hypothetical protein